ncbi:MAG: c-type cytochrome [Acidobacteria bacterium]|nr:c-type cytochrome [Acidobacteriota bacterium]
MQDAGGGDRIDSRHENYWSARARGEPGLQALRLEIRMTFMRFIQLSSAASRGTARLRVTGILSRFALGVMLHFGAASAGYAEAIVAGVASSQIDPELKGQVLIEELNCAACHAGDTSFKARSKKAPRLAEVGSRVNPSYLQSFILNPHATKPGTTMPDVLSSLGAEEKKQAAAELTQFLLSLKPNDFSLQPPDAVAAQHGKRLFHSRGCAACHSPRDDKGTELLASTSVPLGALDKKYSFKSLVEFLRQPQASRPSGRMPDLRLPARELERIANYLLQDTRVPGNLNYTLYRGDVWEGLASDKVTAERAGHVKDFALENFGKLQQHTAIRYDGWVNLPAKGRYTFFLKLNGGSLIIDGKPVIEQEPSDRRGGKQLQETTELDAGWHSIQVTYFHTGREAKFSLEMEGPQFARGPIPSSMLSISKEPIPAFEPLKVDAQLAARGREQFGKLGCASCHDDLKVPAQPSVAFAKLAPGRGCLSDTAGSWPRFRLNGEQRNWITQALPRAEQPKLDDQQQINKTLVTFNCIACHAREGLGGITPERDPLFTTTQPSLGDQGRLPPPLTHVGAKLTTNWLADVLLRGKRQRAYVDAAMPQFGEANVGHLVDLFGKVDALEPAVIPKVANVPEFKKAGHQMIGATGLSCIACHEFSGQKSGEMSAVDLAQVSGRLKKNWFHLYLRQPSRFHPHVIMPTYWPDGDSALKNILAGDAGQQIEAIWTYLEDGERAKKPLGLSRQSNEVRVGDVTEICRGNSPVGFRGIGVGYPERINLAFDAGEMALRQLWKGEFASVDSGSFRPRGTDQISFPAGIPFHRLKSLDDPWPYKGKSNHAFPQDHGYQFRGYHLDAARRPTLLYHYGDIAVEDFFEDVRDRDGKGYFKRTLRFETATEQSPFYFRAAVGKKIATQSDRSFGIDKLQLRVTSDHKGIVREGDNGEVLISLTVPKGRSTLTLEYQW